MGTAPGYYAPGANSELDQEVRLLRSYLIDHLDDPKIAKGLNWLRVNQEPSGEWRGSSVNKKREPMTNVGRLMSDAATAFAVLALSH